MNKFIIFFISFLIASFASAETVQVPLTYLLQDSRDPVLRGQWDKLSFPLTILDTQQADSVRISLALKHSGNIDKATIWLNLGDKPLANIQLQPDSEQQQIVANLTPTLLAKYGNQLTLSVRHLLPPSLSMTQQRIAASEAITEILVEQSFFELAYSENAVKPTLASFAELIRSGQVYQHDIQLESLLTSNSDTSLSVASLLVQGWTLRSGSDKYRFSYHHPESNPIAKHQPANVRLVYGTQSQLEARSMLPTQYLNAIQGPFLGLYKPVAQNDWILVVSGRSENEVVQAAQHFAIPSYELPKQLFALVSKHQPMNRKGLESNQSYQIGMLTRQQQFGDEPLMLPLMMPANIMVNKEETAQLNLLLTHPKVNPGEAAMVIRINGDYANSIPLRASLWRSAQHYRLTFPMDKLHSGLNTVSVELYGPEQVSYFDQGAAYQPFTASLSPTSAINLGAWVTYIPAGRQQISADELLIVAANNGKQSQLTLNYEQLSELSEIWQLISFISHKAHQPMLDLLLTTNKKQTKPINLVFTVGEQYPISEMASSPAKTGFINQTRQNLLSIMNNSGLPSSNTQTALFSSQYFQYSNNPPFRNNESRETSLGVVSTKPGSNWSQIEFIAADSKQLTSNMEIYLSQQTIPAKGAIQLAIPSYGNDIQLARAGFINYPYSLPLFLLCLIFPLALLIQRSLGDKS